MKFVLFQILSWLLLFPVLAQARTVDLGALDNKSREDLLTVVPALKKTDFTLGDLENAIKWLVEHSNFDSAEYLETNSNGHFIIKIGKTQRIHSIKITGNNSIPDFELSQIFAVSPETVFDRDRLLDAGERIRQHYKDEAFYNCVVDLEFQPYGKSDYDVNVKITENVQSRVSEVRIDTRNTELESKLKKMLNKKKGSPFTQVLLKTMSKDVQAYFVDNHYFKAELSEPAVTFSKDESQVTIDFKVDSAEMYVIESPETQGSVLFSDVRDAIGLDHYTTTAPNISLEIASKMKAYYISQGYTHAEVNVTEKDGAEAFHRYLSFNIVEGFRVKIEKIEFTGHMSRSEKFYEKDLKELSSPVIEKGIFVKADLDKGIKNLIIDRQNNGYFKAKVVSLRTSFNTDHDKVTITINFDEGPLTQIQKITFEGVTQVPEAELLKQLNLKQLAPLRLNQLEGGIANIKKYYRDQGFLEMNLMNEQNEKENLVSYNEDNTLAILHFKIFEGPKVIVSSIVVEGNTLTHDYVILKEVEFKVGDTLTPALIDESLARLQRSGLFGSVDIRTLEEKTMVSRRTVLVRVTDRDPGVYNFGAGITNELGLTFRGFGGVAYRNIGGVARAVSLRADFNDYASSVQFLERKISAGYLEPYLFDTRLKLRSNFTQALYIADYNALIATDVQQFTFSLEQEVTSHFLVRWDLYNWAKYDNFSINNNPQYPEYNVDIGSIGPTFELDYRDNPFSPTKGSFTKISAEYGAPGVLQSSPTVNYWRAVASFSYNWNFYKKFVWANMVRVGFLQNLEDPQAGGSVPWLQKGFLLGGPTTIRGFTNAEAFPSVTDLGVTGNTEYQLTTNATMYLIKSELRFPLKGNIGGLVFYDGGAVLITGFNYGFGYRHSAGIGATYNTPVGAVSAEIGWKLNEMGNRGVEGPYALDLSIGTF